MSQGGTQCYETVPDLHRAEAARLKHNVNALIRQVQFLKRWDRIQAGNPTDFVVIQVPTTVTHGAPAIQGHTGPYIQ